MVLTKRADCLDILCIVFLHLGYPSDFTVVQVLNVSPYVNDHKYSEFLACNIIYDIGGTSLDPRVDQLLKTVKCVRKCCKTFSAHVYVYT